MNNIFSRKRNIYWCIYRYMKLVLRENVIFGKFVGTILTNWIFYLIYFVNRCFSEYTIRTWVMNVPSELLAYNTNMDRIRSFRNIVHTTRPDWYCKTEK